MVTARQTDDGAKWCVELPDRSERLGSSRPKAIVCLSDSEGEERWVVPAAVGKSMSLFYKDCGGRIGSRAELAYEVKRASLIAGKKRIESLLNRRDYSTKELLNKLRDDGFSSAVSAQLVDDAVASNLVNDARFAEVYVRSKCYAGWGKLRIERELSRKGIDARELPGWPESYFEDEDEKARAIELASRRRLTGKNDFQKIVRFLCGKGYPMNVSMDAARQVLEER